jgi:hypothetical protein
MLGESVRRRREQPAHGLDARVVRAPEPQRAYRTRAGGQGAFQKLMARWRRVVPPGMPPASTSIAMEVGRDATATRLTLTLTLEFWCLICLRPCVAFSDDYHHQSRCCRVGWTPRQSHGNQVETNTSEPSTSTQGTNSRMNARGRTPSYYVATNTMLA